MKDNKIFAHMSESEADKVKSIIEGPFHGRDSADVSSQMGVCAEEANIADVGVPVLRTDGKTVCEQADYENNPAEAAEQAAEGEDNTVKEQKLGKFKNPQELLRAYGELEKEFTRRSQRLKELERELHSADGAQDSSGTQSDAQVHGADSPTSNSGSEMSEEEWKCKVDKFFKEIPAAKAFARDIANEIIRNPELRQDANCLSTALTRVLADKFRTPEQLMNDGQFLNDYVLCSERVREAVIADYLDGVRDGKPPYTMHSGGMQCVAPKVKPRTIEEAGFMFLKNNK